MHSLPRFTFLILLLSLLCPSAWTQDGFKPRSELLWEKYEEQRKNGLTILTRNHLEKLQREIKDYTQKGDLESAVFLKGQLDLLKAELAALEAEEPEEKPELIVEALIDGNSELRISSSTLYWMSKGVAKPGMHMGQNEPTIVNGEEWMPRWGERDRERGHDKSSRFSLEEDMEVDELAVELIAVGQQRGGTVIERRDPIEPSVDRGEFVVLIPDSQGSSRWYRLRIYHQPPAEESE